MSKKLQPIPVRWNFWRACCAGALYFYVVMGCHMAAAASPQEGYAGNHSASTHCAEVDNIDVPITFSNVTSYRITATHPDYYPASIDERGADFEDCNFTDNRIWIIGTNDGSSAEFLQSAFSTGDEHYPIDDPAAGIDEDWTNMPKEINNDWMYDQYLKFTADESGDANIEVKIGAELTMSLASVSGTLEIKIFAWNGSTWVDSGSRFFNSSTRTQTWSIADYTWLEGTDANNIHIDVQRSGDGGGSTAGAWALYDYIELRKRPGQGEQVFELYNDGRVIVDVVQIDFWWQAPTTMAVQVMGGNSSTGAHFVRIKRQMPDENAFNENFVLYQDGNARIIPFPPAGLGSVPYGASVIIGAAPDSPRPFTSISEVTVDPTNLSVDIVYDGGVESAHLEMWTDRERNMIDVSQITYDTSTNPFCRMRSMWVHDGKDDISRIKGREGEFPIMRNWSTLSGTWWEFFRDSPSFHNTYSPNFKIEVMGPTQSFVTVQAEDFFEATNYSAAALSNAGGGTALCMGTNTSSATYILTNHVPRPESQLLMRYADIDGGDNGTNRGNEIIVYLNGFQEGVTYTAHTGGSNSFEYLPSIYLGDLTAGVYSITVAIDEGTEGMYLDQLELVSQPCSYWQSNLVLVTQAEAIVFSVGVTVSNKSNAMGGQTASISETGGTFSVNIDVPQMHSNYYAVVRYADDQAANTILLSVDGAATGRFPSVTTGTLDIDNPDFEEGPASGGNPSGWWKSLDTGQETWASETGGKGMALYGWTEGNSGIFGQDVYVTNANGSFYGFYIRALAEAGYTSSTKSTWLKMEFWVDGEGANRYAVTNNIYDALTAARDSWNTYSLIVSNNDASVDLIKMLVEFSGATSGLAGAQAVKLDNAMLAQWSESRANTFVDSDSIYLGKLLSGPQTISITSTGQTYGVDIDQVSLYTLDRVNRAPVVDVASPHTLVVGTETNIPVYAYDLDGDPIMLSNITAPVGATFMSNLFTWSAGAEDGGSTNIVLFAADDQTALTNSSSTNGTTITVPYDSDLDTLADGWEWNMFTTLVWAATNDNDMDGMINADEQAAGTSGNDASSTFKLVGGQVTANVDAVYITIRTEPDRGYRIYYADGAISNDMNWMTFANPAPGIGTWNETRPVSTNYTFVDDQSADTTGGAPTDGCRVYQIRVGDPISP